MKKIVLILLALLLASCLQGYIWEHPGKDIHAFNKDGSECTSMAQRARSRMARDMGGDEDAKTYLDIEYDKTFEDCMKSKGWRKVKDKD